MSQTSRYAAVIVYLLPVIGWLYVLLLQRQNSFAIFHLKQVISLCLFLLAVFVGWGVIAWLLAWIPLMASVSVALFTMVIVASVFTAIAWIIGLVNALSNRLVPLPVVGRWADRLPVSRLFIT